MKTISGKISVTMVFNLLALAVFVANAFGFSNFQADDWVGQLGLLIVIAVNLVLRYWKTREPIAKV